MIGSSATDRDLTVQRPCDASLLPAGVVELADTPALGAGGFGRGGSNPSARMDGVEGRYIFAQYAAIWPRWIGQFFASSRYLATTALRANLASSTLPPAASILSCSLRFCSSSASSWAFIAST